MLTCLACGGSRSDVALECPGCGRETSRIEGFYAFDADKARAPAGFDPQRFAFLSGIQDQNFWFRGRNELISWTINRCFPAARSLLEIGCGSGAVLSHLSRACPNLARLAGSDGHVEGLRFAAERLGTAAPLFQMNALRIPWREEFDVVGAFDVIEHIEDDAMALAGFRDAIRPGGGVIITVPQHRWLWSRHDDVARHVRRYEPRELARRVEDAGFEVVLETSFVSMLLPLMLISRWRERARPRPETEGLEVSGVLNRALYRVMRLEQSFIAAGVRFPLGGSRILAARRP